MDYQFRNKLSAEELKKNKIIPILFGIFFVGFSIRYITHHDLLFDPDSYLWYRMANYYAGINTEHIIEKGGNLIDTLAYYPTGRNLDKELFLLPWVIGYSYKLLSFVGLANMDMMDYMFIFGPFFGGLTAVAGFFVMRELTNVRVAAFSSTFYAFSSNAFTRNTAGDTGQESLGTFLIFMWIYFFIKAAKEEPLSRKQIYYSLAGGIILALANSTWGGNFFYYGMVLASVFFYTLLGILREDNYKTEKVLVPFSIVYVTGAVFSYLLIPYRYPLKAFYTNPPNMMVTFMVLLSLALVVNFRRKLGIRPIYIVAGLFTISLAIAYTMGKLDHVIEFFQGFIHGKKSLTGETVAYYRMVGWDEFKNTYGVILIGLVFAPLLLAYEYWKDGDFRWVFLFMWLILGAVAFRWMVRLSFLLALILPTVTFLLADRFTLGKEVSFSGKKKAEKSLVNPGKFNALVLIAVVFLIAVPNLNDGVAAARALKFSDNGVKPWQDAGQWIKENTPENALLIHWWDYGYHLQTFAERRTIVDGGNAGPPVPGGNVNRNVDVAKMFTSTEDYFPKFLEIYNPEDLPVYVLVSVEEFGKSGAINFHAGDELFITSFTVPASGNQDQDQRTIGDILKRNQLSTYHIINYGSYYQIWTQILRDNQGNYHPEWSEKLLAKLLPFNTGYGQGLKHFQLVYQNGWVYIYRYLS